MLETKRPLHIVAMHQYVKELILVWTKECNMAQYRPQMGSERLQHLILKKLGSRFSILPEQFNQGLEARALLPRDVAATSVQQYLELARARLG